MKFTVALLRMQIFILMSSTWPDEHTINGLPCDVTVHAY